jgi:hypothetical protein
MTPDERRSQIESPCYDQLLLLQDERATHEAVRQMRDAQPENHAEIARLQDEADSVSLKLREHLNGCLVCKRGTSC